MVERPIKKSERQQIAETSTVEANTEGTEASPVPTPVNRELRRRDDTQADRSSRGERGDRRDRGNREDRGERGRGKGKGRDQGKGSFREEKPVNMALMRGPKPVKPQPPVEELVESPPEEHPVEESLEVTAEDAPLETAE